MVVVRSKHLSGYTMDDKASLAIWAHVLDGACVMVCKVIAHSI